ncbi:MAG: response regulator transcription factor [Flavobacteriales bacterium]|nr:response regulator transcription factor [Flavobacteriales bacterium]MCB9447004.1 response regulator transcription factor [Flavobacteriales bacterium]
MIRSVIIDDEANGIKTLTNQLATHCPDVEILGTADGVENGKYILEKYRPDLVFLDIRMQDGTGFDLLTSLPAIPFHVVFTTAYDEYAIKAIRFHALDYLLKPINPDELIEAMKRAAETPVPSDNLKNNLQVAKQLLREERVEKIALPNHNGIELVSLKDIIRCQADNYYTIFYLIHARKIMVSRTLKEFDELLSPENFLRVHQSHLINLAHANRYSREDGGTIVMSDDCCVPISRRKKEIVMEVLERMTR